MPNSFFQFKKFKIHQDKCAMKVCTDACLFGAWITNEIQDEKLKSENISDIGAGTGLLSLMIAQKIKHAKIDAVEIDESAAIESAFNFQASPWKERLKLFCVDIRNFQSKNKYDLIVCNPPFFENDLKTNNEKRNIALHSNELNFEELLIAVENNITEDGKFAVLLPYFRSAFFEESAKRKRFYLEKKISVKQTAKHHYFRSMLLFRRKQCEINQSEIVIKKENDKYTKEFTELLKDYYLHL